MPKKKKTIAPTEAELAILRILWSEGPSTVRDVHELLGGDKRSRYTTTLKQLQVMAEKRLVKRDESQRSHVYIAVAKEEPTEKSLVSSFVSRMLAGSTQKMVMHALESGKITDEELDEIRKMLKQRGKKNE